MSQRDKKILDHYDEVADQYDNLYTTPEILAVAREVMALVETNLDPCDRILDLGCGTGFFLDHIQWPEGSYLGIEPSRGMCDKFRRKYPGHAVKNSYLTKEIIDDFRPTIFLALYAVADHLSRADIDLIVASDYFVMFSTPSKLSPTNPLKYFDEERLNACLKNPDLFSGRKLVVDNSYLLVSNRLRENYRPTVSILQCESSKPTSEAT